MQLSTKQLSFVALACLGLGILFDVLFYAKIPGVSLVIYTGALVAVFFWLANYLNISFYKPTGNALKLLALAILFFSTMVGVRDSNFLGFWNIIAAFGLLLIFAGQAVGRSLSNYRLVDFFITAIVFPLKCLEAGFRGLAQMVSVKKHFKDSQTASQVVKGVVITLPILFFFLLLLSSADLVFGKLVSDLFHWNIDPNIFSHFWWIIFSAFVWLGVYAYMFQNSSPAPVPPATKEQSYFFGRIEAGILFGTLNALFLVFVIIQIKYLFAGHSAITDLGYTYAEYVHKGFGELVAVAILSFLLIFGAEKYTQKHSAGHFTEFKVLSGALIALLLVIMASAFTRLTYYEQAYGFTLLRLLVQSFIVWLSLIFLLLYWKVIKFLPEKFFSFWSLMLVIAFFVFWNVLNPDAFIARKNIEQFAAQGKLDMAYLNTLSADAVPEIIKLLDASNLKSKNSYPLSQGAAQILIKKRTDLSGLSWQSYNFSRSRALELINQSMPKIKAMGELPPNLDKVID